MKHKKLKIFLVIFSILILLCGAGLWWFCAEELPAQENAAAAMADTDTVTVRTEEAVTVFLPQEPAAGLIFYPGAKVDHIAYAPLMQALAQEGVLCVLVEMPLNMALLQQDAAEGIPQQFPAVENWYIGGHSLGGYCASNYVSASDEFRGLLLLAAYSVEDLTESSLSVLSIYGSEDKVLSMDTYEECFGNLPDGTIELVLEGGNHAQFGDYGFQKDDGEATVSPAEQIQQTVDAILPWMGIFPDPIQDLTEALSVEEKVGQLFLGGCSPDKALTHLDRYHLGGFTLFSYTFDGQTPDSVRSTLAAYQEAAPIPLLLAVDEEGGIVNRISSNPAFRKEAFPSARSCYAAGGMDAVLANETEKCQLLASLGINVNLGPICDITTNPRAFMYPRSLGQDAHTTGQYITETISLMDSHKIGSSLKHFPGYGNNSDTHVGIAIDSRPLAELEANDLVPFRRGIAAGCDAIMVSHTIVQALDSSLPASLSPAAVDYIRNHMGFEGVIVTDDLAMYAVTAQYGVGEAAVLALLAGCDLLCSTDFEPQYAAVLEAVNSGRIPMETLDTAVYRILQWKADLGLLKLS